MNCLVRVKNLLSKRGTVKPKEDPAALKELYKERARMKEEARREKEKRKEALEEAAFLYRLQHFELYPPTPRRRGGSQSPGGSRSPGSRAGSHSPGSTPSRAATPATGAKTAIRSAKTSSSSAKIYTPNGGVFTPGALSTSSSTVEMTPEEIAEEESLKQLQADIWTFSHSVRQSMVVQKLEPLNLSGMNYGSQSLTGRAIKNFDRVLTACPMINDPASAFLGLLDGTATTPRPCNTKP